MNEQWTYINLCDHHMVYRHEDGELMAEYMDGNEVSQSDYEALEAHLWEVS